MYQKGSRGGNIWGNCDQELCTRITSAIGTGPAPTWQSNIATIINNTQKDYNNVLCIHHWSFVWV